MGKATLVVMAAGIGSRFKGGIKQLEPVGPNGEFIMDYSIYDAVKSGFDKVVFVIRREMLQEFQATVGKRIGQFVEVEYVYQELNRIPEPYKSMYTERVKPWGTGQAILCCKDVVREPFLVINADDFYGRKSYEAGYKYLMSEKKCAAVLPIGMVGFVLKNTLSDNGGVTRGICEIDDEGKLINVVETRNVFKKQNQAVQRTEVEEKLLDGESVVSMNMWAFTSDIFGELEKRFEQFLKDLMTEDYTKQEYLLPTIVGQMLRESSAQVTVVDSQEKWFGLTYKEDKDMVQLSIQKLMDEGMYPSKVF